MGGVTINTDGEVLNGRSSRFARAAAGEVVGGSTAATVSAVTRWRISSSSVPSRAIRRRNVPEDNL